MVHDATLRFETRRYDDPLVAGLIEILQADFVVRYGGPDAARVDPDEFAPPHGEFLVGFDADGTAVAMGGFRRLGYARAVLARLEADAAAQGFRALVLNTGRMQPEAIELYASAGYEAVPAFGHYAATPGALFFGRRLG